MAETSRIKSEDRRIRRCMWAACDQNIYPWVCPLVGDNLQLLRKGDQFHAGPKNLLNRPETAEAPSAGWLASVLRQESSPFIRKNLHWNSEHRLLSLILAKAGWVWAVRVDKMYRSKSTGRTTASHSPPRTLWPRDNERTWLHPQDIFPRYTNPTLASSVTDPSEHPAAQKQNCSESHLGKSLLVWWMVAKTETPGALFPTRTPRRFFLHHLQMLLLCTNVQCKLWWGPFYCPGYDVVYKHTGQKDSSLELGALFPQSTGSIGKFQSLFLIKKEFLSDFTFPGYFQARNFEITKTKRERKPLKFSC